MKNQQQSTGKQSQPPVTANKTGKQGTDKAPGEETNKQEQVTDEDLKGKKVDRDVTDPKDEPLEP
jgi:hypothetical protein